MCVSAVCAVPGYQGPILLDCECPKLDRCIYPAWKAKALAVWLITEVVLMLYLFPSCFTYVKKDSENKGETTDASATVRLLMSPYHSSPDVRRHSL